MELGVYKDCSLKYYNVQKQESRFILGFDTGKNMYYIKKCILYQKKLQLKVVENWIPFKKVSERTYLSPSKVEELGAPKIDMFQILYCAEMEK